MKIGFTGTRNGMTTAQKETVKILLSSIKSIEEAHHGDCVGADADFHKIAEENKIALIGHPASDVGGKRAYCSFLKVLPAKPPLDRNRDIVAASDILIATPKESHEVLRSGTWATIRYGKAAKKQVFVIAPDGTFGCECAK